MSECVEHAVDGLCCGFTGREIGSDYRVEAKMLIKRLLT
jgi:hypothetical protein